MKNQKEYDEKLNEIRSIAIIETRSSGGYISPEPCGIIITKNKEIYSYKCYVSKLEEIPLGEIPLEEIILGKQTIKTRDISKIKELTIDEYNKVIDFIENEIIGKEFYTETILDATYDVIVNYNGEKELLIRNNLDIYYKTERLIYNL